MAFDLHTTWAAPNIFNSLGLGSFFSFPQTRRGRATAATTLPIEDASGRSSVTVSKDADEETDVIARLIDAVMQEVTGGATPRSS